MSGITVVVPVGPDPVYKLYLMECIQSVVEQMGNDDELLLVDDQANLSAEMLAPVPVPAGGYLNYVKTDWLVGCAAAWNIGVGLARNENCILMGSDDKLLPACLDRCRNQITSPDYDPKGYYNLTCTLSTGEQIALFNNAAMVSKTLWYHLGGFPISASVGGPDALVVSIMMVHMPEHLHQLAEGTPLYWCRVHAGQDTLKQAAAFNWEVIRIRDIETARWQHPAWTDSVQSRRR